jgi:hypothetical protein
MKNVLLILGLALLAYGCGKDGSKSSGVPICQPGQYPGMNNCTVQGLSCQGQCAPGQVQSTWGQCYPADNTCSQYQAGCGFRLNNVCNQGQQTQVGYPYGGGGYPYGQPYGGQYPYGNQYGGMYAPPNYMYYQQQQPRCQTTNWGFTYCTWGF